MLLTRDCCKVSDLCTNNIIISKEKKRKEKGKRERDSFKFLPWRGWTEGNGIISTSTCKCTRSIIVCVAIRPWASSLEHLRVDRRPTSPRRAIRAAAAVLRAPKSLTRALTSASPHRLQLRRTLQVQIRSAPGRGT